VLADDASARPDRRNEDRGRRFEIDREIGVEFVFADARLATDRHPHERGVPDAQAVVGADEIEGAQALVGRDGRRERIVVVDDARSSRVAVGTKNGGHRRRLAVGALARTRLALGIGRAHDAAARFDGGRQVALRRRQGERHVLAVVRRDELVQNGPLRIGGQCDREHASETERAERLFERAELHRHFGEVCARALQWPAR
jgi:hypothetical protein